MRYLHSKISSSEAVITIAVADGVVAIAVDTAVAALAAAVTQAAAAVHAASKNLRQKNPAPKSLGRFLKLNEVF